GDVGVPILGGPGTEQIEEGLVADRSAERVQYQSTALVDAVVEHVFRPRVRQKDVLGFGRESPIGVECEFVGRPTSGILRPEPFRVTGETFVQPDVAPALKSETVAEPLMRQ